MWFTPSARARRIRAAAFLAVLALLVSGCGGLVGGAIEAEQLEDGQRTLENVREDLGEAEVLRSERTGS